MIDFIQGMYDSTFVNTDGIRDGQPSPPMKDAIPITLRSPTRGPPESPFEKNYKTKFERSFEILK